MKITHPVTRAAFGVAALVAIALLANWLVSLTPLGNRGVDFTEKNIHTLSDGTKAILSELDTPVVIRYYATRNSDYMPEELKLHMRRVDDLLEEYASLSGGKLRIENLDPEPDTDAEDSASLDGINGQRFDDQNLYFGLAISCLDRTSVLPFIDPRDETMLEYHLSRSIAEVSTPSKPKIGVISAFDLGGAPAMGFGQEPSRPWVVYQQLKQTFDVVDIPLQNPEIKAGEIKALLLLHPAAISPEAEFAIDQYLLAGGTVIACLDAHSVTTQMTGGNPMMGGGPPTMSTLPKLLDAWGVEFESGMTLADPAYATQFPPQQQGQAPRTGHAVLTLPNEAMPQKDNVITRDLASVTLFLPGGFTRTDDCHVAYHSLLRSSNRAGYVDSMRASQLDQSLATSIKSPGTPYDLMVHLNGEFTTAFPDGKPGAEPAKMDDGKTDNAEAGKDAGKDAKPEWLTKSAKTGNVFLIADVDAFYDRFAFNSQLLNMGMASPINGNASLLLNLMDQAAGSPHLIGARSRAAVQRPFTVVQEMEDNFNRTVGAQIDELRAKERAAQDRLNELQSQKASGTELYLSPDQEAEIRNLRAEQVKYGKLIREQQKELRRQKDQLAGNITLLNVAAMPVLVILFGIGLFLQRRRSTRAR